MDKAFEMWEREAAQAIREQEAERFNRHAPHDYPPRVRELPDRPWRMCNDRTLFGGRLMYAISGDDRGTVGFIEQLEDARVATAAPDMLDALETLFDENGLVTGRRLSQGINKARRAMGNARKGGI